MLLVPDDICQLMYYAENHNHQKLRTIINSTGIRVIADDR
uniref:Uncharacterized protein n=1 Tax=Rhizophora mucronata TaxID=61149 RepID=A0A2P2NRD5_RHIMU